jgi:ketosteroid isomerase-like protein
VNAAVALLVAAPPVGCASGPQASALRAELLRTDAAFSAMSVERGAAEAFRTYLAEDATSIENGGEFVRGRAAIVEGLVPRPGSRFALRWEPLQAEVATSGDLGYTFGRYTLLTATGDEPPKTHAGKYMTVWRRQADGTWRATVDMGNTSPSEKGPAPAASP